MSVVENVNQGGPWRISTVRPNCLRPMLSRKGYQEFAEQINKLVGWDQFGYEMMIFYIVFFCAPPLSALVMVSILFYRCFITTIYIYVIYCIIESTTP